MEFSRIGGLGEMEGYRMGGLAIIICSFAQRCSEMRGTFGTVRFFFLSPPLFLPADLRVLE